MLSISYVPGFWCKEIFIAKIAFPYTWPARESSHKSGVILIYGEPHLNNFCFHRFGKIWGEWYTLLKFHFQGMFIFPLRSFKERYIKSTVFLIISLLLFIRVKTFHGAASALAEWWPLRTISVDCTACIESMAVAWWIMTASWERSPETLPPPGGHTHSHTLSIHGVLQNYQEVLSRLSKWKTKLPFHDIHKCVADQYSKEAWCGKGQSVRKRCF